MGEVWIGDATIGPAGLLTLVVLLAVATPAAAQQGSLSAVQVGQLTARAGEQFSGTVATFSHAQDPDPSHFTATILWGDGSSSAGVIACRSCQGQPPQFEVRGTHTWAGAGDYPVSVTVTYPPDQATSTGQGSAHVVAQDQQPPPAQTPAESTPPPAGLPVPEGRSFSATAHQPFSGVVAAVPAGTPVKLIVIDWGDGTKSAGAADGDGNISGSHTFAKAGLHQVTTTVTGPLGSSVASSNARVNLPDPPRECVTKVAFAKLSAVGTCILKIDDNTWETKGDLRVRVNGIDIEPVGTARIRFLKKSLRLTSIGKVIVRAGPVTLYTGVLKLDAQADIPGGFNVSVKAEIAGFPIEGGVAVRFKPDPTTSDYGATLDVHLGLPALFGGFTGDVGLRLSNQDGLVLDKLRLEVASVYLGALHVQNLFVDYRRIGNEWRGGAKPLAAQRRRAQRFAAAARAGRDVPRRQAHQHRRHPELPQPGRCGRQRRVPQLDRLPARDVAVALPGQRPVLDGQRRRQDARAHQRVDVHRLRPSGRALHRTRRRARQAADVHQHGVPRRGHRHPRRALRPRRRLPALRRPRDTPSWPASSTTSCSRAW